MSEISSTMDDMVKNGENEMWNELASGWEDMKSFINNLKSIRTQPMEPKIIHFLQEVDNYMKIYLEETKVVKPKVTTKNEEKETKEEQEKEPTEEEFDIGDKVMRETIKTNNADLMNILLTKLDNRTVPSLENFNDDTAVSLEQYILKFESYCRENFKGGRDLWIGELEKHLSGKTLEGFRSVRQMSESYETLKYKLLEWYDEEEELRRKKAKKKFENAKMNNEESLSLYGNRLLTLFKRAFPDKRHETSGTIIDKYTSTIPASVKNLINSQILSYKLENRQITWTQILKCARVCELESKEVNEDEEDDDVVVINFSKSTRQKQRWNEEDEERREYRHYKPHRRNEDEYKPFRQHSNHFSHSREQGNSRVLNQSAASELEDKEICTYCKKYGHTADKCRNKDGSCYKCGRVGHFARQCRSHDSYQREFPDNRQPRVQNSTDSKMMSPQYSRSTNSGKRGFGAANRGRGSYENLN